MATGAGRKVEEKNHETVKRRTRTAAVWLYILICRDLGALVAVAKFQGALARDKELSSPQTATIYNLQ